MSGTFPAFGSGRRRMPSDESFREVEISMATVVCPYCNIEVNENAIEAEDGCCPECGALLGTSDSLIGGRDDEYEDDEEREDDIFDEFDEDDEDDFSRSEFEDDAFDEEDDLDRELDAEFGAEFEDEEDDLDDLEEDLPPRKKRRTDDDDF